MISTVNKHGVLAISHDLFGSLVFVSLFSRINTLCELVARYQFEASEMKCDIRCFAFPDCYIMDRIAILLVLLTEGNYSVLNSTRTYAYYDRRIEMIKQSINTI